MVSSYQDYSLVSEGEIIARLNEQKKKKPAVVAKRKRGRPPMQIGHGGTPVVKRLLKKETGNY